MSDAPTATEPETPPPATPAPASAPTPRPALLSRYGWVLGAAAAVLLAVGVARLRSDSEPMTVTQRAFSPTLDEADPSPEPGAATEEGGVRVADPPNLELSVKGSRIDAARLLVTDAKGVLLRPIAPFEVAKDGDGVLRAYVVPRSFAPHDGDAVAWIVAGTMPAVTTVFETLPYPLTTLGDHADAPESPLHDAARRAGAEVARIPLGATGRPSPATPAPTP